MNKKFFILFFLISSIIGTKIGYAQKESIKCKMSVNEVMQKQKYNIDQQEYRDIKRLTEIMFNEFNLFYSEINKSDNSKVGKHFTVINNALETAKDLEMNYSMFNKDIKFLKKYYEKINE